EGPADAARQARPPQPLRARLLPGWQRHAPGTVGKLLRHLRHPGCGPPSGGLRLMLPTTFVTTTTGRRVRLARLGTGPPLVLLHGYPDNLQIWCKAAPQLAESFEALAVDCPGLGYSDPWPGGATPMPLADRLRQLLDAWLIERASVVGLDMGGQPALAFAARHPQRIQRLVVMNSLVFGEEETSWEIRILRKFGWNRLILRWLPGVVFRRAERTFLPRGVR